LDGTGTLLPSIEKRKRVMKQPPIHRSMRRKGYFCLDRGGPICCLIALPFVLASHSRAGGHYFFVYIPTGRYVKK
jgi:hypothetical protein